MKKRTRKRFFTLIEVLISMTLMAFLSTTLFFWVRFALTTNRSFQDTKWIYLEEHYCFERVEALLSKSIYQKDSPTKIHTFFSHENRLVFTCDFGSNPQPKLSKDVLAELFLDEDHILSIAVWPVPLKGSKIEETPHSVLPLLDHVEKIEYSFYFPPEPSLLIVKPEEVGAIRPKEGWNDTWDKSFGKLPALAKIIIHRQKKGSEDAHTVDFLFEISSSRHPIFIKHKNLTQKKEEV
jgi:hypothetical protein